MQQAAAEALFEIDKPHMHVHGLMPQPFSSHAYVGICLRSTSYAAALSIKSELIPFL